MINRIINKLKKEYHVSILHEDVMEYQIQQMRNAGYVIGEGCKIYSQLGTIETYLIEIGDNVTIAGDVAFITHDNSVIKVVEEATDTVGKVKIGNNCFIGERSIILPGVTIADNTIVAAGSVVVKSVDKQGLIIGGNPARIIGNWDDYSQKVQENCFNFDGKNLAERKQEILDNREKYLVRPNMQPNI